MTMNHKPGKKGKTVKQDWATRVEAREWVSELSINTTAIELFKFNSILHIITSIFNSFKLSDRVKNFGL